jgi:propanol-preferring alcohol dehydrogenase
MKAWVVHRPGPVDERPLRLVDRPTPAAGPGEVRVRVVVCGICRTDLHLAEGDLPPHGPNMVPGHEIVGVVDEIGTGSTRFDLGDRVGIAWLRRTCGACRFCRGGSENLCAQPLFTGWDADGGYAEHAVVDERFAYRLPEGFSDEEAAPLLCAGIIGYRALRRAALPAGGRLGIYGFGASAHLTAQVAGAAGAEVYVMTRSPEARTLALELGAVWAGDTFDPPPRALDSAIVFAPAGEIFPAALAALGRGGTLALAGIHMTDIPPLRYAEHLFFERQLRSVTANTRRDGDELLAVASRIGIRVGTTPYPLEAADAALRDLAHDRVTGAAVLRISAG